MARDGAFWKNFYRFSSWVWYARCVDSRHHNQSSSGGRLQKKESIGKSRGGNTTKIHVAVDALGNSLKVKLTGGQVHDVTVAAYDCDKLRAQIRLLNRVAIACVVIPFNKIQYKERHKVECQTLSLNCYPLRQARRKISCFYTCRLYSCPVALIYSTLPKYTPVQNWWFRLYQKFRTRNWSHRKFFPYNNSDILDWWAMGCDWASFGQNERIHVQQERIAKCRLVW